MLVASILYGGKETYKDSVKFYSLAFHALLTSILLWNLISQRLYIGFIMSSLASIFLFCFLIVFFIQRLSLIYFIKDL